MLPGAVWIMSYLKLDFSITFSLFSEEVNGLASRCGVPLEDAGSSRGTSQGRHGSAGVGRCHLALPQLCADQLSPQPGWQK